MMLSQHSTVFQNSCSKPGVTTRSCPTKLQTLHAAKSAKLDCARQAPQRLRQKHQTSLTPKALSGSVESGAQLLQEVAVLDTSNPLTLILPISAVLAGAAALKFYLYSQLEVITASMLTKYVPKGGTGATVIQLGGGTRELYYYPKDTMTVINVGENVNKGLMEQAGVTAAVPTIVRQQPITDLGFQADSSVDAVVALGVLSQLSQQQRQQCLEEISRVLRPGKPLIFVEPVKEGGSPIRGLIGVSAGKQALSVAELEQMQPENAPAFSYAQFDVALQGQDPHAVGVAVRSETYKPRRRSTDADDAARKQRRKDSKKEKAARGFQ